VENEQRFTLLNFERFMNDEYMDANKLMLISAIGALSLTATYAGWSDEAIYNDLKDAAALTAQQMGMDVFYRGG
jgi:hypothetical protein